MEEYLFQLLENNNRVIVPEFGAFIVKKRHPLLLVFNEFLQYNDGMLIDLISKKENIDGEKAKVKVEQFINDINKSFDQGKGFSLKKLGFLVKNKSGKISLEDSDITGDLSKINDEKEITLETEKIPPAEKSAAIEKEELNPDTEKPVKKVAGPEITKNEKQVVKEADIENKNLTINENIKNDFIQDTKTKLPEISPEEPKSELPKDKEITKTQKENITKIPNPENSKKTEPEIKQELPKSDYVTIPRKKRYYVIWALAIIFVNALIFIYFFQDNRISDLFQRGNSKPEELSIIDTIKPSETKPITLDTSMVQEKTTPKQNLSTEKPVENIAPQTTGAKYYIVAGVFREEKNAQNFVRELKKKGYNSEQFGKIGTSFGVSYDVFTSKSDADKALLKIKNGTDAGAWIKVIR